MAPIRWLSALILPIVVTACSTGTSGPRAALGEAVPEVPGEVSEEVAEGSAALEGAGLDEASEPGEVRGPNIAREVETAVPGAFLYPAAGELRADIRQEVDRFIHALTEGRAAGRFASWLERESVWGDWIRARLLEAELPEELVYLAMIESGFHPTIVSHAGATGMWQFMGPTARASGLRVDDWVDERRDPEAATRAALRHLSDLHDATGDWALATAAYNAGLGRVTRAQARAPAGERDYYGLVRNSLLPRETRNYVPIMLAASWVDAHRSHYGLPARRSVGLPAVDTLTLEGRTRLSAVAEGLGLEHDALKELNAHLVRGAVPPEGGTIRTPADPDVARLGTFLAGLLPEQRLLPDWIESHYRVASGDSWWAIARRHDTTVDRLRGLNPRRGDVIHPGDRLVVKRVASYDRGTSEAAVAAAAAKDEAEEAASTSPDGAPLVDPTSTAYTVRPGDTMTGLARRLGVSIAVLAEWNGMKAPRPLQVGETLVVRW